VLEWLIHQKNSDGETKFSIEFILINAYFELEIEEVSDAVLEDLIAEKEFLAVLFCEHFGLLG